MISHTKRGTACRTPLRCLVCSGHLQSLFLFGQGLVDLYGLVLDIVAVVGVIEVGPQVHQHHEAEPAGQYGVFFYKVKHILSVCRLVREACLQFLAQVFDVHVYAYEDEFLHAVAIGGVPVVLQPLVACQDGLEFLLGHGGIPLSCLVQGHLSAGLFEEIAHVFLALEVAHALGAYDALGPLACHEVVKVAEVQRSAAVEHPCADAVFIAMRMFGIVMMSATAVPVFIVVMMVSAMRAWLFGIVVVVMVVLVFVMVVMVVLVLVVVMFVFVFVFVFVLVLVFVMVMLLLVVGLVQFLNPFCRGGNGLKVEHAGVEQEVEVHIAEVARDDVGLGLYGVQYGAYASQFLLRNLIGLVEQYGVAELYLLDDEVGDVVLGYSIACKVQAASELVLQTECIHHGADAVQRGDVRDGACVEGVEVQGLLVCTDGLCYGGGFADAGGFDDNVVEALGLHQVAELQDEVHLQRAADASVLQGNQRVVLLVNDSALLYEVGIDVHLADVVYDDGKAYTSFIIKYAVQQGCLAAAQITGYE